MYVNEVLIAHKSIFEAKVWVIWILLPWLVGEKKTYAELVPVMFCFVFHQAWLGSISYVGSVWVKYTLCES